MSDTIKVFEKGSEEREKLEIVALLLKNRSPNGYGYYVDETYFDFGQDWKWTTIICTGRKAHEFLGREKEVHSSYQALYPRDHEKIIFAERYDELVKIAEEILNGKHCPDRK